MLGANEQQILDAVAHVLINEPSQQESQSIRFPADPADFRPAGLPGPLAQIRIRTRWRSDVSKNLTIGTLIACPAVCCQ